MQINFSIEGEVQLSRVLNNITTAISDWTPALGQSAEDLIEVFSYDVFETEGAALGTIWAPLSMAYQRFKDRRFPGQPILTATGRMRESFTSIVDTTSLIIGNTAEYFKYHQSRAPRTSNLPRRVMLKLTENMKQQVVKNFQTQLLEEANR